MKLGTDQTVGGAVAAVAEAARTPWPRRATRSIELALPYPPTGNSSTRHTRGGAHYKTGEALAYRAEVAREVGRAGMGYGSGQEPLRGPLGLSWLILPPDRIGRDVDNVRKELADALTRAGLWVDDSNRVIRREAFEWGPVLPGGRIELTIEVLG